MAVGITESSGYDEKIERLAAKAFGRKALRQRTSPEQRVMIAICGIPGSGKSTLAASLVRRLNALYRESDTLASSCNDHFAMVVPMDGYHLSRAQLAAMPDPATAIHRRGAAFTFDSQAFYELVQSLREPASTTTRTIYAPGFDHAIKDPVAGEIAILPESRVLVFEGLYLALDREPWRSAAKLMDELWFINVEREVARARLVKRHVASGIVPDEAAARHRISSTDFLNADDILENQLPIHEIIEDRS